jgi:hypothetical protein
MGERMDFAQWMNAGLSLVLCFASSRALLWGWFAGK